MMATQRRAVSLVVTAAVTFFHVAVLAFIVVSTLLAPPWAVAIGVVVWLASLAPFLWAVRARPLATPLVPLAVIAAWIAFLTFGDLALGWTA